MKTKMTSKRSLKALASLLLAIAPMTMFAQFNRTTYFMDGVSFKQKLNPVLARSTWALALMLFRLTISLIY